MRVAAQERWDIARERSLVAAHPLHAGDRQDLPEDRRGGGVRGDLLAPPERDEHEVHADGAQTGGAEQQADMAAGIAQQRHTSGQDCRDGRE